MYGELNHLSGPGQSQPHQVNPPSRIGIQRGFATASARTLEVEIGWLWWEMKDDEGVSKYLQRLFVPKYPSGEGFGWNCGTLEVCRFAREIPSHWCHPNLKAFANGHLRCQYMHSAVTREHFISNELYHSLVLFIYIHNTLREYHLDATTKPSRNMH